jgi:Phytanoyl-CoA dioxygenase (PhyH)
MLFPASVAPIRHQLKSVGYVHLKDFISRDKLDATKKKAIEIAYAMGFLKSPSSPAHLRNNRLEITFDDHIIFATALKRTRQYQELLNDTQMCLNLDLILGSWKYYRPELDDAGVWARFVGPSSHNAPLPPHQDGSYHGPKRTIFGLWFPLEDCPRNLGALALLPRSHLGGCQVHDEHGFLHLKVDRKWYRPSLKKGDCLIFSNLCVHGPQKNLFKDQPRFSIDCRIEVSGDSLRTLRPASQR